MITIDPVTYSEYLSNLNTFFLSSTLALDFNNCVFNINGNFLLLDKTIKVTFTNCVFNVANT